LVSDRKIKLNHVLLNEYQDGMGIAPHKDGLLYEDFVIVLSMGGNAVIDFFLKEDNSSRFSVCLASRSLLIFTGDVYQYYHEITERSADTIDNFIVNCTETGLNVGSVIERGDRRLSLTIREVKRICDKDTNIPETAEQKEEMMRREQVFYSSISEKV